MRASRYLVALRFLCTAALCIGPGLAGWVLVVMCIELAFESGPTRSSGFVVWAAPTWVLFPASAFVAAQVSWAVAPRSACMLGYAVFFAAFALAEGSARGGGWAILNLALVGAGVLLASHLGMRVRERKRAGRCSCGYKLLPSQSSCPECGSTVDRYAV